MNKPKFCPAMWFSGFFALGALVHLVRLLLKASLVVGGREIPMGISALVVVLMGLLSLGLFIVSVKRPCCKEKGEPHSCSH